VNGEPNGDNGGLPPLDEGRGGPLRFLGNPRVLAPLVLLTIGALAVVWWTARQAGRPADLAGEIQDAPGTVVDLPRAGDRAVVLVFPRWNGDGWISEDRRVPSRGEPGEDLLALMTALCDGPGTGRAISALPRGTRALAAFVDPARGTAFVDWSRELVAGHPGGSAAETGDPHLHPAHAVAVNFPRTRGLHAPGRRAPRSRTLAGHLDLARPAVRHRGAGARTRSGRHPVHADPSASSTPGIGGLTVLRANCAERLPGRGPAVLRRHGARALRHQGREAPCAPSRARTPRSCSWRAACQARGRGRVQHGLARSRIDDLQRGAAGARARASSSPACTTALAAHARRRASA
jgi:hypothetical protein